MSYNQEDGIDTRNKQGLIINLYLISNGRPARAVAPAEMCGANLLTVFIVNIFIPARCNSKQIGIKQ
jgi:hypothetical protein